MKGVAFFLAAISAVAPARADYWVFTSASAIAADSALTASNAVVPPDTLINGQTAPTQYTRCWANNVVTLSDGRLAFRAQPGASVPSGVSATLTEASAAALLPVALLQPCCGAASVPLSSPPFSSGSLWNTPVPSNATYTPLAWPAATGSNYWVNWDSFSSAICAASAIDPVVSVPVPSAWGYPAGTISIQVPRGVTGNPGSDAELIVVANNQVYSFWEFNRIDDTHATAAAYGKADISADTGWGTPVPFRGAGIVAAGSSVLAGMLMQAETDAGEINHALQISLASSLQQSGFVAPAINGDGSSGTGIAKEGQLLAIPPGTSMPGGLSPLGQKVFRALQSYGAYDVDVAGVTNFRAQTNAYDAATITSLRHDANVLIPLLQRVN